MDALRQQAAEIFAIKEKMEALCDCLFSCTPLSPEVLQAQIHRRRFESTRIQHPLNLDGHACLPSVVEMPESTHIITDCLDQVSLCSLIATSSAISGAAALALPVFNSEIGSMFVCGGYDGTKRVSQANCYDPARNTWKVAPPMALARESATAACVRGDLYVIGGFDGTHHLRVVDRFLPQQGRWQKVEPMAEKRRNAAAASFCGHLVVCGGFDGETPLGSVEAYDVQRKCWQGGAPMSATREGCAAAVVGGQLYLCGGNDGSRCLNTVERLASVPLNGETQLTALGGVWETMPAMIERRDGASAAALRGRLVVCGGFDGQDTLSTSSTERFDPPSRIWRKMLPMLSRRACAATAVVGGKLYVFGGYDGAQCLRSCERLDPGTRMWEMLPLMNESRGFAAGVAIEPSDGRVDPDPLPVSSSRSTAIAL